MEVVVQVSGKFEYIVNRLLDTQVDENGNPVKTKGFTMYELAEFTQIKSTYAKTMYRLLKQWRTIGRRELKIEEFKTLLDAPKTYKSSHIDRLIIKPIMKELPAFFKDLKVKKVKAKTKGNPVKSYIFTWTPEGKRKQAEVVDSDSLPAPVEPVEVPVFDSLEAFFGAIEGISVDNKKAITDISSNFEPTEALAMLAFAESLRKQKAKSAIAYTITVIKEWAENGVKTLEQAKKFHEVNYSQKAEQKAPKAKKSGKKQAKASGETNIPNWSSMHPDNADKQENNILAPDFMEKLIEAQIAMEIFDKPEGIAEREKRQKEIDEALAKRAELEAKKWELLGRPDTLEEKE